MTSERYALVLLPGLHGNDLLFRPLLSHLPSHIRRITVSYPPARELGYEDLLPKVLSALPADMPFVLLGESFSGPLAVMAAATRPPGLRGLVLVATFVRNPVWSRPGWLRHLAHRYTFRCLMPIARVIAPLRGCKTPELRALSAAARADLTPAVMSHRVRSVLRADVREELAACPVPVLYLHGDRDGVVGRRNLADVMRIRPTTEVVGIAGAPHMVLQTRPAESAEAIARFMATVIGEVSSATTGRGSS